MKAYPEYKESNISWIGKIPNHWNKTSLKNLCYINDGNHGEEYPKDNDYTDGDIGVPFIRCGDMVNQKLSHSKMIYITKEKNDSMRKGRLKTGDVLFANRGDIGKSALVTNEFDGSNLNSQIAYFRTNRDKLKNEFLLYFIISNYIFNLLNSLKMGSVLTQLPISDLSNIRIPFPSISEQESIVAFLNIETARIDNLISEKEIFIKLLQEKRQALISHVVTKGLDDNVKMKPSGVEWIGDIPEHWEVKPMKYLGLLGPTKSEISGDLLSKQCSFVPMDKLKTDTLLLNEERIVKEVIDGYTYFQDGDILFAKVTPCFENKNMCIAEGLTNGIGFGSSEINVFRTNKFNETKFVYYLFQEEHFMQFAKSNMTGTGGLKRVPSDVVLDYKVAVPPLTEQVKIAEEVSNRFARLALLIEETKQSIELLKEHRTALISAAVTGKIDVREAV